jgi:predicted transcriptional regulator YheO
MSNNEIITALNKVASAVAQTFGPHCEVAVCSLEDNEVVAIENGHVTGRKIGDKIASKVSDYFVNAYKTYPDVVVYPSHSIINGRLLKCSTLIINNSQEEPIATFSINIDMESLKESSDASNPLLFTTPFQSIEYEGGNNNEANVVDYTKKLMIDIIHTVGKPLPLTSKEGKITILKELEKHGVLLVKDIFPSVCEILDISQATLYNYLREIHNEKDTNK